MRPLKVLPVQVDVIASRQEGLISAAQLDGIGVDAQWRYRLVRQGRLIRVTQGVYDTDVVPPDQRSRADLLDHLRRRPAWLGLLAAGPGSTAVGLCALALYKVKGLPRTIRSEVVAPDGLWRPARDGITFRKIGGIVTGRFGGDFRIASVADALALGVGQMYRDDAVAVMDDLLHTRSATADDLARAHDLARGHRDVEATHSWWRLPDGRSESPLETSARLACLDAGIPPDTLQLVVRDPDGAHLGRVDLAWRLPDGTWLLVEIDGASVHTAPAAVFRDRTRQNALASAGGSRLLRFTAKDLRGRLVETLEPLLREAGWAPGCYDDVGQPAVLGPSVVSTGAAVTAVLPVPFEA
ncbi:type IV toxin-antitoxin system AbiEi family antitoxin domain-containing protein [Promicromonospora kroppenstedtii]|uniref:type IV toxin-antitoxin system AbiEi family antitoxin domain-containing protein n=1 Tax=Promicromonospora kroppenstedtii TaxID=440482 RepID=UPI0004BBAD69|nr:type IV toxin-antitoxin system AbiEi family antitoxin domain-containing protein [Promicromonospora kroppenstedtii]